MNTLPPAASGPAGTLFVVAAPSGAGKSSLVSALLEVDHQISLSVSHTTRLPRPHEVDGQHYCFVGRAEFERGVAAGIFLEHAEVHGNHYGSLKSEVLRHLATRLQSTFRGDDVMVARTGGEEFGLILRDADEVSVMIRVEAFREALQARPIVCAGIAVPVGRT